MRKDTVKVVKLERKINNQEYFMATATPTITIDESVPFSEGLVTSKYPFKDLKVGQSFLLPLGGSVGTVRGIASQQHRESDKRFTIRKTPDGYRCWRTA
jgi:hypothetical protein